jgi:RHS repeat-associated protein
VLFCDGNLLSKVKPGRSATLYLGGLYEVDLTSVGVTTKKTTYYPGGAMRVDIVGGSNTLYYSLKDHLGSASTLLDTNGNVVANGEQRYYPYGEKRITSADLKTAHLFTGQLEVGLGGIYSYGARMYSPRLGRFLSADTIVPDWTNPQSLNRYSYVLNSPLKYIDPTGHSYCDSPYADPEECDGDDEIGSWSPPSGGGGGGGGSDPLDPGLPVPTNNSPCCTPSSPDSVSFSVTAPVYVAGGGYMPDYYSSDPNPYGNSPNNTRWDLDYTKLNYNKPGNLVVGVAAALDPINTLLLALAPSPTYYPPNAFATANMTAHKNGTISLNSITVTNQAQYSVLYNGLTIQDTYDPYSTPLSLGGSYAVHGDGESRIEFVTGITFPMYSNLTMTFTFMSINEPTIGLSYTGTVKVRPFLLTQNTP